MTAMNQNSATEDGIAGITRRIKDYCDQAVENLKAGRLEMTYLLVNEALELDVKDAKVAALYRHALYALHPKKRLLDKAKTLHEEADQCMKAKDNNKALELISLAKKWHCNPGILYTRSNLNLRRSRFDLAYVDSTEGLAECQKYALFLAPNQRVSLSLLGYKVFPVIEADPLPNEMPARYHVNNWPMGLRINHLHVYAPGGYVGALMTEGMMLKPHIPLGQLAQFLNNHVQGAVQMLSWVGRGLQQSMVLRLLDEVTVPGRLHLDYLNFTDFFHLSWASIERIFDGRTLRANTVEFFCLQLPSGVDENELLKLPVVRGCTRLRFSLYTRNVPQPAGLPPLFNNAALEEWIKRSGGRSLQLTSDYLSSGLLSFLDTLKKDFQQATQVNSYEVTICCPHIDVVAGLGVQYEELSNRLGEKMLIGVGEDPGATDIMGHQFETVFVVRLPPS